jgi:hypothetical protein
MRNQFNIEVNILDVDHMVMRRTSRSEKCMMIRKKVMYRLDDFEFDMEEILNTIDEERRYA